MPVAIETISPDQRPLVLDPQAFCRQARRLRHQYRGDMHRMHGELQKLSIPGQEEIRPHDPGPAGLFAQQVQTAMDGRVLRYSNRLHLLAEARRMGIGRFEANLIIAAIQHRRGAALAELSASEESSFWKVALSLCSIQTALLLIAWWLMGQ